MSFPADTSRSSETGSARGRRALQPWLTVPLMYLGLMFVAAVRLRRNDPDHPRGYRAPMLVGLCGVGLASSLAALLIGFIPPSQFGGGSGFSYFLIVGGGALGLGLLVPFLFYRLRKPSWKQPVVAEGVES